MKHVVFAAAVLVAGCATSDVVRETSVIDDYIVLSEMVEVDRIREYRGMRVGYLNDDYAAAFEGDRIYLIRFDTGCKLLSSGGMSSMMVDHRLSYRVLHRRDTIRGCPIDRIYVATEVHLEEIAELARMPTYQTAVPESK
jgi:hypothetical protein